MSVEYVREGVCLLCGGAVLNSGEHIDEDRHAAEVELIVTGLSSRNPAPSSEPSEAEIEGAWWRLMEAGELPRPRGDGTGRQLFEAGYRAAPRIMKTYKVIDLGQHESAKRAPMYGGTDEDGM
ncbi:hypothetical protein SEA_RASPUTIA_28 [Microbacterium phage Rasputia]|nr:hypothetical protein SEA_RASPUTIA_28 [Microbacterium phage Rasputia]